MKEKREQLADILQSKRNEMVFQKLESISPCCDGCRDKMIAEYDASIAYLLYNIYTLSEYGEYELLKRLVNTPIDVFNDYGISV